MPPSHAPADRLLAFAESPSRDALRHTLKPHLHESARQARTLGSIGGGRQTDVLTVRVLSGGSLPTSAEMKRDDDSWPREFFELIRYGDEYAPWQAFACWLLLAWVTEPEDDGVTTAEDETVVSLADASRRISPDVCAAAAAFLRWQVPRRNDPGPTVYHELGIACLLGSLHQLFDRHVTYDALDHQCRRTLAVSERETLAAISTREIYNINWPLDLKASTAEKAWRSCCKACLAPAPGIEAPESAATILSRVDASR